MSLLTATTDRSSNWLAGIYFNFLKTRARPKKFSIPKLDLNENITKVIIK